MTTIRRDLLRLLGELCEEAGELRLGQLIVNLATLARGANVEAIWDVEDEELMEAAKRLLQHYQHRNESVA